MALPTSTTAETVRAIHALLAADGIGAYTRRGVTTYRALNGRTPNWTGAVVVLKAAARLYRSSGRGAEAMLMELAARNVRAAA